MSVTTAEYVERVFYAVGMGMDEEQAPVRRTAIEAGLDRALQELAEQIASHKSPAKRSLLQDTFSFTLSGGEVALTGEPTLMRKYIPISGYVTLTGVTEALQWLPHRRDLDHPPPLPDYQFYCIADDKIRVVDSSGTATTGTALSILGSYVPTISQVSDPELVDELVNIGIRQFTQGGEQVDESQI